MFAGPNGSGKSTLIGDYLAKNECPAYYICPDSLLDKTKPATKEEYVRAMEKAEVLRENAIEDGKSFTFETVLSTSEKIDFIARAKERGYNITTIYVATVDPSINVARIAQRVKDGGHDVPPDKVIERYERSLSLMPQALELSDNYIVFDNSSLSPVLIIQRQDGIINLNPDYENLEWVSKYILRPCGLDVQDMLIHPDMTNTDKNDSERYGVKRNK